MINNKQLMTTCVTQHGLKVIQELFDKQQTEVYNSIKFNKQLFAIKLGVVKGCISYTQKQLGGSQIV